MKTAILIDGAFYRKKACNMETESPEDAANALYAYCRKHINLQSKGDSCDPCSLYRILYYDCPPSSKKVFNPLTQKTVDWSKSKLYTWSTTFLEALKSKRKLALRMGLLADAQAHYSLKYPSMKKLLAGHMSIQDLTMDDFMPEVRQKGVDTRICIDIVTLAIKRQVDQIILIAGDSDFVPAAKLARREGIDFILDPMRHNVADQLLEHIDGLRSFVPKKS